ncbi:MAG: hypothetical protein M3O30_13435 [Planctomycetota bacterium]|nr:hypothetical protein [Planctomycetota bacterium]
MPHDENEGLRHGLLSGGSLNVDGWTSIGGYGSPTYGLLAVSQGAQFTTEYLTIYPVSGHVIISGGSTVVTVNTQNSNAFQQTGGISSLGAVSGNGSLSVGNPTGSSAYMTVTSISQQSVLIDSTGVVAITGTNGSANSVNSLQINSGGLLNLGSSALTINYGTGLSPNAVVAGYISSGYHNSAMPWTGTAGITSSSAASDPGHHSVAFADGADGVVVNLPGVVSSAVPGGGVLPAGNELVTYAYAGDANLDGKVDFSDFVILSNHYGGTFTNWDQGNFNYDSTVDFSDFVILSNNFGEGVTGGNGSGATALELARYNALAGSFGISQGQIAAWDATIASLPEPGCLLPLVIGVGVVMRRGRGRERGMGAD